MRQLETVQATLTDLTNRIHYDAALLEAIEDAQAPEQVVHDDADQPTYALEVVEAELDDLDELQAEVRRLNQALNMVIEEREAWKAEALRLRGTE